MVKKTGPTNHQLTKLIEELKVKSIEDKSGFWKRIATDLEKPSRQRRVVNLGRINKFSKENETIVVPGKILGDGALDKKVNVVAFSISDAAKEKIINAGSQVLTIKELMKKDIKTSDMRIMG